MIDEPTPIHSRTFRLGDPCDEMYKVIDAVVEPGSDDALTLITAVEKMMIATMRVAVTEGAITDAQATRIMDIARGDE